MMTLLVAWNIDVYIAISMWEFMLNLISVLTDFLQPPTQLDTPHTTVWNWCSHQYDGGDFLLIMETWLISSNW